MMTYRRYFMVFLLGLFYILAASYLRAEDVTISTYYPTPYGTYKNLQIQDQDESPTLTEFTTKLINSGLNIITDYSATGAYTPGIFWSTTAPNDETRPKAGIWMHEAAGASKLFFGTSNAFGTGITNNMVLDQDGNLGINITAPSVPVHAVKNGGTAPMETLGRYGEDATPSSIALLHGRGTQSAPTTLSFAGDGLGAVRFQGVNTSSQNYDGAVIQGTTNTAWSDTSASTNLIFSTTAASATASVERMRVTQDGVVQLPGLTTAPTVSAADTGRIYYDATTDKLLFSHSGGTYLSVEANQAGVAVCATIDTTIAFSGYVALDLRVNGRNICADANGCQYRVWVYTATLPAGINMGMYSTWYQPVFRQDPTTNKWCDARGVFAADTGTNGDGVATKFMDWLAEHGGSISFRMYDDSPNVSLVENDPNKITLEDLNTARGYAVSFCD